MKNSNNYLELDKSLKSISKEIISIPNDLTDKTLVCINEVPEESQKVFPYVLAMVFLVNILVSLFFGGILFLIRPITLVEWIVIGSVYSTTNVILYGITFLNYNKLQNILSSYSARRRYVK